MPDGALLLSLQARSQVPTLELITRPTSAVCKFYSSPFTEDIQYGSLGLPFDVLSRLNEDILFLVDLTWLTDEQITQVVNVLKIYLDSHRASGAVLFDKSRITRLGVTPDIIQVSPFHQIIKNKIWGNKLMQLLIRKLKVPVRQLQQAIIRVPNKNSDHDYYNALRRLYLQFNDQQVINAGNVWCPELNKQKLDTRASYRVQDMSDYLPKLELLTGGYLDIGASDGSITEAISKAVNPTITYAYDLDNYLDPTRYNLNYISDYNQIPDSSLKLVTAMVSLHHVPDLTPIMVQIQRVLISGGLFVIREHDFTSNHQAGLIMVQHLIYDVVTKGKDYDQTLETNALQARSLDDISRVASPYFREIDRIDLEQGIDVKLLILERL